MVEALYFSGYPAMRPTVCACVRNTSLLTGLQLNGLTEFYQTLEKCSVPSVDELIRFWQGSNLASIYLSVCNTSSLARYLLFEWLYLHHNFTERSLLGVDELNRFWKSSNQRWPKYGSHLEKP